MSANRIANGPALAELLAGAHVVAIPTRTQFRGISVREAVIFDAPNGASEFSPFTEYDDTESAAWLSAAIEFGWGRLPAIHRDSIDINATVPAVSADEVPDVLARFPGCRTAKVKVAEHGQVLADDVARVRAVRKAMGADARVRIDANGGWSVDEAAEALGQLAPFELEYAEQPCATVTELVSLRERVHAHGGEAARVRVAADESVRKASDPLLVAQSGAVDLIIVKAQPLGGIAPAVRIIAQSGLPAIVSSALDTSVGIAMGLALAAALPEGALAGACGLGTVALLGGDVTEDSLTPVDGRIAVRRPQLSKVLLEQFAASPERTKWWHERIERCHALISDSANA